MQVVGHDQSVCCGWCNLLHESRVDQQGCGHSLEIYSSKMISAEGRRVAHRSYRLSKAATPGLGPVGCARGSSTCRRISSTCRRFLHARNRQGSRKVMFESRGRGNCGCAPPKPPHVSPLISASSYVNALVVQHARAMAWGQRRCRSYCVLQCLQKVFGLDR
jgi:hypothetical protein